jgi:hypothetical protein
MTALIAIETPLQGKIVHLAPLAAHEINSLWADFSKQMSTFCFAQTTRLS